MSAFEKGVEASLLVTRAAGGRHAAHEALKRMKRNPRSFEWLKRYVTAAAQVEEAELALLRIKKELGK
jgi:hypothetical protein